MPVVRQSFRDFKDNGGKKIPNDLNSHRFILVRVRPYAGIVASTAWWQDSTYKAVCIEQFGLKVKTKVWQFEITITNASRDIWTHISHAHRFRVNSTRGQLDTCIELTACRVDSCVELTLVKSTHGQLDTSRLVWKKVKCNVKIKGERRRLKDAIAASRSWQLRLRVERRVCSSSTLLCKRS